MAGMQTRPLLSTHPGGDELVPDGVEPFEPSEELGDEVVPLPGWVSLPPPEIEAEADGF